ncbi:MAG: histidine kinase [Burkholderiaceae bacterium]
MSTPAPVLDTPRNRLAGWLARQALMVLLIALTIGGALVLVFHQAWKPTLIYCFSITLCCAGFIQGLRLGTARLLHRLRGGCPPGEEQWPGWPLMLLSLLLGTGLGYTLGVELGNWITGFRETGPFNSDLRHGLTIMAISLVPGLGLTLFFVGRGRLAAAEARAQLAQRQAAEHQLRLLEAQLEPHMLFNTLANLRVLIGMDPARAQAMLDQLIGFLRATLAASRSGSHSLREEFARLADYLALMQVRMGSRLRPVFELPAELAERGIPPLLLQPLVENAIKHGLEPHIDGGELRISARREQGSLLLQVRDSGVGLQAAEASPTDGGGSHFGLHQVRERLATRYGEGASLAIEAVPAPGTGTLVSLRIPLE